MAAKRQAYSYLRFSTPEQSKGDSRRRQSKLAEEYALSRGLLLDDKLTFRDLGVSAYQGKNAQSGQLGDFLRAVEVGQVPAGSFLLVESLDRVSRRYPLDALDILKDICRKGVTVVTLTDGHEYTHESLRQNFMSLMMSLMVFQRAHEESATKATRLRASWEGKRGRIDSGEKMTGKVPGWLWLDKATGKIKVHRDRATIVKRIFRDTLKGTGKHAIARALNDEGVPVFGHGQHWHRSYIAKILSSPTAIGTLLTHSSHYNDDTGEKRRKLLKAIPNYYPAIIDAETFERVQALQQSASPLRGRHAASGEVRNLFSGLARCPKCSGTMTRVNKGEPPKGGAYLVCAKAKVGAGCTYETVKYGAVEEAFHVNAAALLNSIPAGDSKVAAKLNKEIDNLETLIEHVPEQIENLVTAISRGQKRGVSSVALETRLQELEADLAPMRERLQTLRQQRLDVVGLLVERKCEDLLEALKDRAPANRTAINSLLRQVFSGVLVDKRHGQLIFQWKHGGESSVQYAWAPMARRAR